MMMRTVIFSVILVYVLMECNNTSVEALECGLADGNDHDMIQKIANSCSKNMMNNNSNNLNNNQNNNNNRNSNKNNNDKTDTENQNDNNNDVNEEDDDEDGEDSEEDEDDEEDNANNDDNNASNSNNKNSKNNNNRNTKESSSNTGKNKDKRSSSNDSNNNKRTTTPRYNKLRPSSQRLSQGITVDGSHFGRSPANQYPDKYNVQHYNPNYYPMNNNRQGYNNNHNYNYENHNGMSNGNNNNNNATHDQCTVITCILKQLHMVDSRGFPERSLVSQALMKNVHNPELRNFLQESTDDCFELMNEEFKKEPCEYSNHLISCLAEKGRNNCDDWQDGNISF